MKKLTCTLNFFYGLYTHAVDDVEELNKPDGADQQKWRTEKVEWKIDGELPLFKGSKM